MFAYFSTSSTRNPDYSSYLKNAFEVCEHRGAKKSQGKYLAFGGFMIHKSPKKNFRRMRIYWSLVQNSH